MPNGHEATQVATHGTAEARDLLRQMYDIKARLFRTPEAEQPELRAEVGRLTQEIRRELREGHRAVR